MSKKKSPADRPLYSSRWLSTYGRGLTRDEIRLVQGYRGLPRKQQAALLQLLGDLIVSDARAVAWTRAGARARLDGMAQ